MQRNFITILTLLLIAAGVWITARNRNAIAVSAALNPEETVQTMLQASRSGDAPAYLNCFSGALRAQLEENQRQMGPAAFRAYLAGSQSAVMGVATTRLPDPSPSRARFQVEFVLRDKNQQQTIDLGQTNGLWRIEAMSQAAYVKPVIPYGTKVFEEPAAKAGGKAEDAHSDTEGS